MNNIANFSQFSNLYESHKTTIYRAMSEKNHNHVVLKMHRHPFPEKIDIDRFQQEFQLIQKFKSQYIIKAIDLVKLDNRMFIVLEDIEGESLSNILSRSPFSLKNFLTIAIKIVEGISIIHQANIIHNDINPSNIIYNSKTDQVQIIDFGIATQASLTNPSTNIIEGTMAYMSPEQTGRIKRWIDYRSDYYALGITFYELITGQHPFPTKDSSELIHCHIAKNPTPPHQLSPDKCPESLSDLIMKLISKNPEERYQSNKGIAEDLKECLNQVSKNGTIHSFQLGKNDISDQLLISKKIYGRDVYLNQLRFDFNQWFSSITDPKSVHFPMVRIIKGNAGIGKSALIQECQKIILSEHRNYSQKRIIIMTGHCDQYLQKTPYSAISEAVKDLSRQLLMQNEVIVTMLQQKLNQIIASNGHLLVSMFPDLKYFIEDQKESNETDRHVTDIQNRFHIAFQQFLNIVIDHQMALILCIDNLQWADDATLQLLRFLITSKTTPIFMVGALRENERHPSHSVQSCFDNISQSKVSIKFFPLAPIANEDICMFVSDTLHCQKEKAVQFSKTIMDKTLGNPFFIIEFIQNIYKENLLTFNHSTQCWEWDITKIKQKTITQNVADQMIHKIRKLSSETENILKLAACIGHTFSLTILKHLNKNSYQDIERFLNEAVEEGFIIVSQGDSQFLYDKTDTQYQFIHQRFQEAAYSLLSGAEIMNIHWSIGQIMLENPLEVYRENHLFDIVHHLNHSIEKDLSTNERHSIIHFNFKAGIKSKISSAWQQSFEYFSTAMSLLDNRKWQDQHEMTSSIYIETIESCYYISDFKKLHLLAKVALQNISSHSDKIRIFEILMLSNMAEHKLSDAIHIAITALKILNIRFPKKPKKHHVLFEIFRVRWMIAEHQIENLITHKPMKDSNKLAAMRILLLLSTVSYYISSEFRVLVPLKMVWLSLKFGNSPLSPFAYAVYGSILCSLIKQIDYGYLFGKLSTSMVEYQNITKYDVRTSFVINSLIRHWKEPVSATLDHAKICYENAINSSDIEFAAMSAHVFCYMAFYTGRDLVGLEKEMKKYSDIIKSFHQEKFHQDNEMNRKCVINLMGKSSQIFSLVDQSDSEDTLLNRLKDSRDQKSIFMFYFNKLLLSYYFHNFQKSVEYADNARIYLNGVVGLYLYPLFIFFDSLARLAVFTSVDQANQKRYLKMVRSNQKKMKRWASHAPMNHMHKYYLVEAEKHRVIGKDVQASDFFEQAIQMAKAYQFIQEEAIAYELAAKYYLIKGKTDLAKECLLNARHCFMQWGAMAKVEHMDNRYHQLLTIENDQSGFASPDTLLTSTTSSALFDITTVMKASQAISTEIVLDRLLERLMEVIIENAGAQKGFLILKKDDSLIVEAQITINTNNYNKEEPSSFNFQLAGLPIGECEGFSKAIVNYVARTGENIVLGDATNDGLFTGDVYVMQHRPRSLLCIPIKRHQFITGILYLENNYATDIFTVDRLEILQLFLSQAAISIENAKFYEQLEKRVEDRTRELQETLFELKHSEKKYRGLYQSSKDAIILLSKEFVIQNANDAALEMSGYPLEELKQLSIRDITPQKWIEFEKKITHEQVFKRGFSDEYEKEIIRKDGTLVPLSVRTWPLKDKDGNITGIWSIARDISERKRAERLREDVERIVRHDLKTPLNGIIGAASLFKNYDQLTRELCEKWSFIIEKSAHNILHMIEHSLDVFKMEEGVYELDPEPCNLVPIFHQLRESLENLRSVGQQHLVFMINGQALAWDDEFMVMGEDIQLQNMFANLLKNALEASPEKETITISLNNHQNHNEIIIHNMGVIPEEIREHFFDRYATSGKSGGTGIGTYSALLIAKIHGGSITFKTSEEKGTELIVNLPILESVDNLQEEKQIDEYNENSDEALPETPLLKDKRILLAEDNAINRSIFMDMLSAFDVEIDIASNGYKAVEAAKTNSYDAIFMDIQMPRMDGIEASKCIREFDETIPIIAMTAHAQLDENDPCIEAGMNDYITKPFHIDTIKRILNQWLDIQKKNDPDPIKQNTSGLPEKLPGILVHEALERTSGYKSIFFELLDTFINRYTNIDKIISQLLETHKDDAIDHAHSLKGAAANLSMIDVAESASELEKALRANDNNINKRLNVLKMNLDIVMDSIETLNKLKTEMKSD